MTSENVYVRRGQRKIVQSCELTVKSSSKLIEGLKVTDETGKYRRIVILKTDERELVYIYSIRERLVMSQCDTRAKASKY